MQVFTGILLAMNYAPTPGEAYNSVRYIATELTGGRMIRGLHHWGASMMIVVVVLHMVQTFLWGAYKKPREATWIAGVFCCCSLLAYGLTGYLLPWDNRAYWGTVVATQIAASAPGPDPYVTRLLGGEGGIGVVTFATILRDSRPAAAADHDAADRRSCVSGSQARRGSSPRRRNEAKEEVLSRSRSSRIPSRSSSLSRSCFALAVARVCRWKTGRSDRHLLHPPPRMVLPVPVPTAEVLRGTAGIGRKHCACPVSPYSR